MKINDFFNPHSHEHLEAVEALCKTGVWPKEFWEKHKLSEMEFPQMWSSLIYAKMADCWIAEKLHR